jgi:hypothetical protein
MAGLYGWPGFICNFSHLLLNKHIKKVLYGCGFFPPFCSENRKTFLLPALQKAAYLTGVPKMGAKKNVRNGK